MADIVGYFLTWTTYGTWLPGDDRGWHDWRQGWKTANPKLAAYARSTMTEDAVMLTEAQRKSVEATIEKHCQIRKWQLWASNCRTNHVHVVVTALNCDGETVRDQLKAWCTRNLKKEFDSVKKNWWTEGASVHELKTEDALASAITYTTDAQ